MKFLQFFFIIFIIICANTILAPSRQIILGFSAEEKVVRIEKKISHNVIQNKIFLCTETSGHGFGEAKSLVRNVFPEYEINILQGNVRRVNSRNERFAKNFSNNHDIFLDNFQFISCDFHWMKWLFTHFNGHVILFSGESERENPFNHFSQRKEHLHSFGPLLEPSRNDHVITYMQYTWIDRFYKILTPDVLLNGLVDNYFEAREKFVIYANSNCVKFRERAVSELSHIGKVYCSGHCQGEKSGHNSSENLINIRKEHKINVNNWWKNIDLYKEFQFCLVMEHEKEHKAYITEKILLAYSAGKSLFSGICFLHNILSHNYCRMHSDLLWACHDFRYFQREIICILQYIKSISSIDRNKAT